MLELSSYNEVQYQPIHAHLRVRVVLDCRHRAVSCHTHLIYSLTLSSTAPTVDEPHRRAMPICTYTYSIFTSTYTHTHACAGASPCMPTLHATGLLRSFTPTTSTTPYLGLAVGISHGWASIPRHILTPKAWLGDTRGLLTTVHPPFPPDSLLSQLSLSPAREITGWCEGTPWRKARHARLRLTPALCHTASRPIERVAGAHASHLMRGWRVGRRQASADMVQQGRPGSPSLIDVLA
jgi:hypothetical protein